MAFSPDPRDLAIACRTFLIQGGANLLAKERIVDILTRRPVLEWRARQMLSNAYWPIIEAEIYPPVGSSPIPS